MITEQQQILTTHNLAVLYQGLSLDHSLSTSQLEEMSLCCFKFVCKQLQKDTIYWRHMINLKKSAYAWRHMIFYLSLLSKQRLMAFLDQLEACYDNQPRAFRDRFSPAYNELKLAADIYCHDYVADAMQENSRVFTGWSVRRHWLMPSMS